MTDEEEKGLKEIERLVRAATRFIRVVSDYHDGTPASACASASCEICEAFVEYEAVLESQRLADGLRARLEKKRERKERA